MTDPEFDIWRKKTLADGTSKCRIRTSIPERPRHSPDTATLAVANRRKDEEIHRFSVTLSGRVPKQSSIAEENRMLRPIESSESRHRGDGPNDSLPDVMLAVFGPRLAPSAFVFSFFSQLENCGDVGSYDFYRIS